MLNSLSTFGLLLILSEQKVLDAAIRKLEQSTKRGPENEGASKAHITKVL